MLTGAQMSENDDQEMSMDEILASIRKYVTDDSPSSPVKAPEVPAPISKKPSEPQAGVVAAQEEILDLKTMENVTEFPRKEFQKKDHQETTYPEKRSSFVTPPATTPVTEPSQDPLSSSQTLSASSQAFSRLAEAARGSYFGYASTTSSMGKGEPSANAAIEQLVMKALTPLLRQWLDAYLPSLVENLVQKEIERISRELLKK